MAIKTVLKRLIGKYGILSIEMQDALETDIDDEIEQNANKEFINFDEVQPEPTATPAPESNGNGNGNNPAPPTPETPKMLF